MPGGSADLYKWLFLAGLFCCSSCQSVSSTFENKTGESSISLFLTFLSFSFFFEQRTQTYYVYPIDMLKRGSRDRSRPNSNYDINKYIRNMRLYRPETTTIDVCGFIADELCRYFDRRTAENTKSMRGSARMHTKPRANCANSRCSRERERKKERSCVPSEQCHEHMLDNRNFSTTTTSVGRGIPPPPSKRFNNP